MAMKLSADAYIMALLSRSSRRTAGTGDREPVVVVTHDAMDQSLSMLAHKLIGIVENLSKRVVNALRRRHGRQVAIRELMALNDLVLKDIGLHRGETLAAADDLLTLEDIAPCRNKRWDTTPLAPPAVQPRNAPAGAPSTTTKSSAPPDCLLLI